MKKTDALEKFIAQKSKEQLLKELQELKRFLLDRKRLLETIKDMELTIDIDNSKSKLNLGYLLGYSNGKLGTNAMRFINAKYHLYEESITESIVEKFNNFKDIS